MGDTGGGLRRVTSGAEFARLARADEGALLSLRVPAPGGRVARLVLLSPDGDAAVAYIDRGRAEMACLLAAILGPPV
jgi:hypothetical protein